MNTSFAKRRSSDLQVTLNSWNEVLVNRFDGEHALLDCLRDYLNDLPVTQRQPRLQVRCFCHNRAQFIARRVEEVIETAQTLLLSRRSEEHTSELQSLMRISYAFFCLKKKIN